MKTAELNGAQLDYWVARALDDRQARIVGAEEHERCETRFGDQWPWNRFMPSSAWMDAGPIIEREHITLDWNVFNKADPNYDPTPWMGLIDGGTIFYGATPLVAAMRAYVASKFGEEVPIEN